MWDTIILKVNSVPLLSRVWLFATPWTAAHQASLSITNSSKLMSIELMMPSNKLILCHPLSSCLKSFPTSGSFQMNQLFSSGGQSIGASASASAPVLPINIKSWFLLGLTTFSSLVSKGLVLIIYFIDSGGICLSQSPNLSFPSFPLEKHQFVFYICDSTFAL